MRILILNCPSKTHLYALTPLAWALRTAGHEVRIGTQPDPAGLSTEDVANTGLTAVSLGAPIDVTAMVSDKAAEVQADTAPAPGRARTRTGASRSRPTTAPRTRSLS